MTARSDGSTSPCATTTALMAGKTKAAPERRSQGIPRVSTPYADITQIRFWGLRLSALSAPLSSGAPPSYSVVCSRFYAALRSSAWLTTLTSPRDGATSHATTRTAKDANARISMTASLNLVRGFAVLRRVETEDLLALRHAKSDEDIDELQDHERHDRRVEDRGAHGDRLDAELPRVAGEETILRRAVHGDRREDARGDRAPRTTDAVHSEDIEGVVDAEPLRALDRGVAQDPGAEPDEA